MSIRPKEAFEASQTFSLREALGPALAPEPRAAATGLHFDLGSIGNPASPEAVMPAACRSVQAPAGLSLRFAATPVQPQTALRQAAAPRPKGLPNLSFTSMSQRPGGQRPGGQQVAMQAKGADNAKADVMRLSAYVDELTQRLRKVQSKLDQTECQLTRTSQVLCHERQAADRMLGGYKKDLAAAHEAEEKLRAVIAGTKKKVAMQDSAFMASVGTALASDEQVHVVQRNLQELETKVAAMGDLKVNLEGEVAKLEGLKKVADKELSDLNLAHQQQACATKAASAKLVDVKRLLEDVQGSHDEMAERLAAAKVEEATLSEAVDALRTAKDLAEGEASQATSTTQEVLLQHGEASRSLADVKRRVAVLHAQEAEAREALELAPDVADDVSEFELEPPLPPPPPLRRMTVTGAQAPDRQLCAGVDDGTTAQMARDGFSGSGVAAVLATDAPVELTLQRISFVGAQHCLFLDAGTTDAAPRQQAEDQTATMVNAVVGDLKMKLQEISQQQPMWRQVAPMA
jgi:hypothetical protein